MCFFHLECYRFTILSFMPSLVQNPTTERYLGRLVWQNFGHCVSRETSRLVSFFWAKISSRLVPQNSVSPSALVCAITFCIIYIIKIADNRVFSRWRSEQGEQGQSQVLQASLARPNSSVSNYHLFVHF